MIRQYTNKFGTTYQLATEKGSYYLTRFLGKCVKSVRVPKQELSFVRECADHELEQWFVSADIEERMNRNAK